jgi:hypothetical protein
MLYVELVDRVSSTLENSFGKADVDNFIRQVERKIYQLCDLPSLNARETQSLAAGTALVALDADTINILGVSVASATSRVSNLLQKDISFLMSAYPTTYEGTPKFYARYDMGTIRLAPIPDAEYSLAIEYTKYPESIVTAGSSVLGEMFDNTLFNGVVFEAGRFIKAEEDIINLYDKMFTESLALLKATLESKLRTDNFRTVQQRTI